MDDSIKTPWHLWVVGGVTLLWNGFGAFDFAATIGHFEAYLQNFPPETLDYVYSYPAWMFVVWGIGTWGGAVGSVLLLMRKQLALPVLGASLAAALLSTLVGLFSDVPENMSNPALSVTIIGIAGGLAGYAWWLNGRGFMR